MYENMDDKKIHLSSLMKGTLFILLVLWYLEVHPEMCSVF